MSNYKRVRGSTYKEGTRIVLFDIIRILAIFMVIFNHTGQNGFMLFTTEPVGTFNFWLYMVISLICKPAVPLFFMISGVFSFNNELPNRPWFKKILKYVCLIGIWSAVYYIDDCVVGGGKCINRRVIV